MIAPGMRSLPPAPRRALAALLAVCAAASAAFSGEAVYLAWRDAAPAAAVPRVASLHRATLGVVTGTSHEALVADAFPQARIVAVADAAGQLARLLAGETEGLVADEPLARAMVADHPGLAILPDFLSREDYALAARFHWDDLHAGVNAALADLAADGVLRDMAARWLDAPAGDRVMPEIPLILDRPALTVGVAPVVPPMAYPGPDGDPIGFDLELLARVAVKLDRKLVVRALPFEKLVPALRAGDVDLIASCLTVTPERGELVWFSEPYLAGGAVVVTGTGGAE